MMNNLKIKIIISLLFLVISASVGIADVLSDATAKPKNVVREIESRQVNIWSDGTRIFGTIFRPKGIAAEDKLPAIILCHGWGGVRAHLNVGIAPLFAKAGYVVLTFDYRGWGDSDSRLVIRGAMPTPDANGEVTVRARAIRELVDPFDQTEDIISSLDFLSGEPGVDKKRIGLWGTSFGGGHVVYVAARDSRVRCIVSQVPSMDGNWVNQFFKPREQAVLRARGEIDPVPQGENKMPGLNGTPYLSRIAEYRPVAFAGSLKIPVLIIVAEKDTLIDNRANGEKVYDIVKNNVPAKYEMVPCAHFEIYDTYRMQAISLAIAWFDKYL
jgi:dienelactone hydrolase